MALGEWGETYTVGPDETHQGVDRSGGQPASASSPKTGVGSAYETRGQRQEGARLPVRKSIAAASVVSGRKSRGLERRMPRREDQCHGRDQGHLSVGQEAASAKRPECPASRWGEDGRSRK